ncbi:hypothetical protein L211DRAFT_841447 [Terfezia boudieri ATCC MYA-4762]|uniref:Uncharacterized protein n=1 Tax=Terfezia boudieri ATCC MYA-4762 TaxID=1051890 RepID=A0A3N4LRW0_9PEZI|nr:hypothetical protein L211DRAFT_841447 [Terfezia boudieri ATCC MYA-4762]
MDEENIDCYLYLCVLVFMAAYLVFFFPEDIHPFLEKITTGSAISSPRKKSRINKSGK